VLGCSIHVGWELSVRVERERCSQEFLQLPRGKLYDYECALRAEGLLLRCTLSVRGQESALKRPRGMRHSHGGLADSRVLCSGRSPCQPFGSKLNPLQAGWEWSAIVS